MKRSTRLALITMHLTGAAGWATCEFPSIDWIVVDSGVGKSATQKVTTLGTNTFIGGYAGGETILASSSSNTRITNTESDWLSPCSYGCSQTGQMDMHISKIDDAGVPQAIWIFEGEALGSSPGWSVLHGMEDGAHLAAATAISGNLTLPGGAKIVNQAIQGGTGLVIKLGADGTVAWHVAFNSPAGSSVYSVDGDAAGNMFVHYSTCVVCTADCVAETDRYGRPTGSNAPTCSKHLAMLASSNGAELWKKTFTSTATASVSPGHIRLQRTGGSSAASTIYAWGTVNGTAVTVDSCTITSATGGTVPQAVIFKIDATDGSVTWCSAPTGNKAVSSGYIDISSATSNPVLAVQGGFSGTVTFGSGAAETNLTASHGYYTSFVARLSITDGSLVWAEQTPMARGVQVTPDNSYVGVFAQTGGTTDRVALTDTGGVTTTVRSRGSWDLIAIKLAASNGAGVYAIDGGGDDMEYFHGFGMNSDGDMLISGYSRSGSFHFGNHMMPNNQSVANGGAGDNKIYTIQVSATSTTPSCVSSCASNTPVVSAGSCFIDNYCYANAVAAPYPSMACFKCDTSISQTDWSGPDLSAHCFIAGARGAPSSCWANGAAQPGASSRSPPSSCYACLTDKSTSTWTVRDTYDVVDGSCVAQPSISTTTTTALTTAMTASAVVKQITGSSGLGTSFAAAKNLYVGSILQTLARTAWTGSGDYTDGVAYFNSSTWLDDYILSALDGTGQFAGTLADTRGTMTAARTEAVKKGLQDQILVVACLSSVAAGPSVEANWDLAYAYFYGDDPSGAPYKRANKRSANYAGTQAADGTTAKLNFKVLEAISEGKTACTAGTGGAADDVAVAAAWSKLRSSVLGIYFQAALRYAYLLDNDLNTNTFTADHQGEGGAFWRVIAPFMHKRDALLTKYVTDFYTMTNAPAGTNNRYCPLKYLLEQNMITGFTATDMGTLSAASAVTCMAGIQISSSTSAMAASADVKNVTGPAGMGTSFAAAKTLYQATSLQGLANTAYSEGCGDSCYYSKSVDYFGSAGWLNAYVLSALDGTGQFAGTLADTRGSMTAARTEAVKKGLQDQIMFNAAVGSLNTPTTAAAWISFYSYWTGDDPSGAPWARANKRCKNYGTCGGGTTGGSGEKAQANSQILLATLSALDNPATNGAAAKVTAVNNAELVYFQAALRYAYLLDKDITDSAATADHQGEGGAFWRVIAPLMDIVDPVTSKIVDDFYNMTNAPSGTTRYCTLANMLLANVPAGTNMGTLQGSSVSLPTCSAPVTASTAGAQVTSIVITAPGSVADYSATDIAASAATSLGVSPSSVNVNITAAPASSRRRLQSSSAVLITIAVYTASASDASAMETSLTTLAGTASAASTFLTAATGRTVTVTVDPPAPTSSIADTSSIPPPPSSPPPGGLGGGAIAGIVIAVVVVLIAVGVGGFCVMSKKAKSKVSTGTSAKA
jgi:hypothetical protein